ncbi:MAG: sterol desaturase family protein [Ilumatobacteraceae bacterium]
MSAADLTTKRQVALRFASGASPRVLVAAATVLLAVRTALGDWGRGDAVVVVATVLVTGPVECIIHRFLLHAPDDSWTGRTLGTGTGHRRHHLDPTDIEWLLLHGRDAALFVTAFGPVTAAWTLPLLRITGSPVAGPFVTAWACAAIGLAHYEWVHLLVHSRVRCRSRYYRRLARNHRLHHYRNERYWFGVTANSGDRLLGTYPRHTSDVAVSDTARTLA